LGTEDQHKYLWASDVWYDYDKGQFTIPMEIEAPFTGQKTFTVYAGASRGTPLAQYSFTMKVYNNRDYDVYHTETKYENNSYNIFYNPDTYPVWSVNQIVAEIFDHANIYFNIENDREITFTDPSKLIPVVNIDAGYNDVYIQLKSWYISNIGNKQPNNVVHYREIISIPYFSYGGSINYNDLGLSIPFSTESDEGALAFVSYVMSNSIAPSGNSNNQTLINQIKTRALITAHELGHCWDYHTLDPHWLSNHEDGHNGKDKMSCVMRVNKVPQQIEALSFCEGHIQQLMNINWSPEGRGKQVKEFNNKLSRSIK